jgi:hypothetical protein
MFSRNASKLILLVVLINMLLSLSTLAQSPTSSTGTAAIMGEPPVVTMDAHGCPVLKLNEMQHAAVKKFLLSHPTVEMYDFTASDYTDGSCLDIYQQWKTSMDPATDIGQYPLAAWGDFNRDGYLDIVLFFVSKKPVITHKWPMNGTYVYTYEHNWYVVVFHGSQSGSYLPVVAGRDHWAKALDGVIYHTKRHRVEYWFKTAGGSIQWTRTGYKCVPMKSDD